VGVLKKGVDEQSSGVIEKRHQVGFCNGKSDRKKPNEFLRQQQDGLLVGLARRELPGGRPGRVKALPRSHPSRF